MAYFVDSNAWMTTAIFTQLCTSIDAEMRRENRRVVLFLENTTCHNINVPLTNVKLVFLPPNTTSLIQPLDQGIIRTFKCHYRHFLSMMEAIEKDPRPREVAREVDVLRALQWVKTAWSLVTPTTINNNYCFRKAGFCQQCDGGRDPRN